jgi:hypothetical protein
VDPTRRAGVGLLAAANPRLANMHPTLRTSSPRSLPHISYFFCTVIASILQLFSSLSLSAPRLSRDTYKRVRMVLKLSFACWDYDRMKAIEDGRVRPEGIELTFLNYRVEET